MLTQKQINIFSCFGILFNITDSITTHLALAVGLTEINPLAAYTISKNIWLFHLIKIIIGTWLFLPSKYGMIHLLICQKDWRKIAGIFLLIFLTLFFLYLTMNNIINIIIKILTAP